MFFLIVIMSWGKWVVYLFTIITFTAGVYFREIVVLFIRNIML